MRKGRNSYIDIHRVQKRSQCSFILQQVVYMIITITAGSEVVKHLPSCNIIATRSKFSVILVKCIHFMTFQIHDTLHQDKIWARLHVFRFNCLFILALLQNFSIIINQRRVTSCLGKIELNWMWKEVALS
jgi:hypothetical protein